MHPPRMFANMNLVYGSIFLSKDKVLLVRGRHSGKWSFPKGHPNEGESEFEAAQRETLEETGLHLPRDYQRMIHLATGTYYLVERQQEEQNFMPTDLKEVMDIAWIPMKNLRRMPVNIDVNTFLREVAPEYIRKAQRKNAMFPSIPKV